ncbi:MAG TPA: PilZ domain-containing protein [Xanthobacteraceae bacterium]|nr:PilZ domain-containing protein [Xanthobacteraceae bacterium]
MATERRSFNRVPFDRGYMARIMAIDGTWQRECRIGDVSETGAKLYIRDSVEGIDTKEFFLVLSPTGNAHRRCQRVWINGDEIGVTFLRDQPSGPPRRASRRLDHYPDPSETQSHSGGHPAGKHSDGPAADADEGEKPST